MYLDGDGDKPRRGNVLTREQIIERSEERRRLSIMEKFALAREDRE